MYMHQYMFTFENIYNKAIQDQETIVSDCETVNTP